MTGDAAPKPTRYAGVSSPTRKSDAASTEAFLKKIEKVEYEDKLR